MTRESTSRHAHRLTVRRGVRASGLFLVLVLAPLLAGCPPPSGDDDPTSPSPDVSTTTPAPCTGAEQRYYLDVDGDGFGSGTGTCEPAEGRVEQDGDCDDADPRVHPQAPELCDGLDNDCDQSRDEGYKPRYYRDADHDGFGTERETACADPDGDAGGEWRAVRGDCDDTDPSAYPGAADPFDDGADRDCGGGPGPDLHIGLSATSYGASANYAGGSLDDQSLTVEPSFLAYSTTGEPDGPTCTPNGQTFSCLPHDYHLSPTDKSDATAPNPLIDHGLVDTAYNDPDGSRNDMGAFGGPDADGWDLDQDELAGYWWPGVWSAAPRNVENSVFEPVETLR